MTEAHRKFLDDNRLYVESYQQENIPRHMRIIDREMLLEIVKANFDRDHKADLWCTSCTKTFILNAYQMYDKFLADEARKH